jgi:hypothetical protein
VGVTVASLIFTEFAMKYGWCLFQVSPSMITLFNFYEATSAMKYGVRSAGVIFTDKIVTLVLLTDMLLFPCGISEP